MYNLWKFKWSPPDIFPDSPCNPVYNFSNMNELAACVKGMGCESFNEMVDQVVNQLSVSQKIIIRAYSKK